MRLRTYDASDGDCLLLTSSDGVHALFDGGRKGSFEANTMADLGRLQTPLDLVCVSHVDNDHISGIVELLDAQIEHAVHEHRHDNPNSRPPSVPKIEVRELWHNAFDDVVEDDAPTLTNALVAQHRLLSQFVNAEGDETGLWSPLAQRLARDGDAIDLEALARSDRFATGFLEGVELARKIRLRPLGVLLNEQFKRKRPPCVKRSDRSSRGVPTRPLGAVTLNVLAPTHGQLKDFREEWRDWAEDNLDRLQDLGREIDDLLLTTRSGQPRVVEFALRNSLTPQNLVSIVVLAEENGRTVLLTGDTHQDDVLDGLDAADRLTVFDADRPSGLHVDVLKVQHHGSPNNLDQRFAARVTADHYVFCGNGSHGNPSQIVVDDIIDSRVAAVGTTTRAVTPEVGQPFHLWFTGHPDRISSDTRSAHMNALFAHIQTRMADHPGVFGASVLRGPFFDIEPGVTAAPAVFRPAVNGASF